MKQMCGEAGLELAAAGGVMIRRERERKKEKEGESEREIL